MRSRLELAGVDVWLVGVWASLYWAAAAAACSADSLASMRQLTVARMQNCCAARRFWVAVLLTTLAFIKTLGSKTGARHTW